MSSIPFTQYIPPHGRKKEVSIDRPDEIVSMAMELIQKGYRFECELLSNGQVSLTVVDPMDEGDVAIEIVSNGPQVDGAVDRLVRTVYKGDSHE